MCAQSNDKPYLDPALPVEERVADLLSRMTREEKVAQLGSYIQFPEWGDWSKFARLSQDKKIEQVMSIPPADGVGIGVGQFSVILRELPPRAAAQKANEIQEYARQHTRLGIPPILHDEGLHGLLANDGTSFPMSIGMASSWDPPLLEEVAGAIGREAHTRGIRHLLSPTINIARDPRCGRTEETYGEDTFLTSRLAVAFVRGLQNQGVIATPKHFAANFVGDGGRDSYAIHISERLLREVYLPAFEAAVREAGALSIMAAYNSLDGLPCSCNPWLLTDLLRGEWGFDGFVVSDYDSVIHILEKHHVAADKTEVAKRAVEAGMDVELPKSICFTDPMLAGLQNGTISEKAVDEAVRRVLSVKFRLGLFENRLVDEAEAAVSSHTPQHKALALRMALEGITLLKNDKTVLPLPGGLRSVAVIGPQADRSVLGGYTWEGYAPGRFITPLQAIRTKMGEKGLVRYAFGCDVTGDGKDGLAAAVEAARQSQAAVLFLGNDQRTEGEQRDRANLELPGAQPELIAAVAATGVPVVVVLINGAPVVMTGWIDKVAAVIEAWYPGEAGGQAITEILFGDANPGGKLPVSIPRSMGQLPLFYNYKPSGRSDDYVDLTGKPLFPFGFGLSYTTFAYRSLAITPQKAGARQTVTVSLEVENTGAIAGDEVVQLYVHDRLASVVRPVKELKAFQRISLKPGETRQVKLALDVQQLGLYDAGLRYVVEPGEFDILVGSSSEDIHLKGTLVVTA
jgi:beta-glucosidase